jgi:amino acid adenylation domain-containing protein/thioester reductase-like protein
LNKELFDCYLIGDDQLVLECAEIISSNNHLILGIISSFPEAEEFALQRKIPHFKRIADAYPILYNTSFDYLFSIVNEAVLPATLLQMPRRLAINYHNGPLPKYAGVHTPSWAILNKEKNHGVTWHIMVEQLDAGAILKQSFIEIEPDETGLSLSIKCYQEAINTFTKLIDDITHQQISTVPQNLTHRTYFNYYKKPRYSGWINWYESAISINRLCRALNLGSHHRNRLGLAKFNLGTDFFLALQTRVIDKQCNKPPGTLLQISPDYWQVATQDQIIQLEQIISLHAFGLTCLKEIAEHYSLVEGVCFPSASEKNLLEYKRMDELYAPHELFWVHQIKRFNPALLPFQSLTQNTSSAHVLECSIDFDAHSLFLSPEEPYSENADYLILAALFIYLCRLGNKGNFGVGFSHPKLHQLPEQIAPLFSQIVPFSLSVEEQCTVEQFLAVFFNQVALIDKHLSFASDIYYRYPELTAKVECSYPLVVIFGEEEETRNQRNKLKDSIIITISKSYKIHWYCSDNNKTLHAIIENSAQHLPILLREMLSYPANPILKLSLLTSYEKEQMLVGWNQTATNYPKNKNVVMLFLEQVQKNPKKMALYFQGVTLTYEQLNQKSNQLAHQLQKTNDFVGKSIAICTDQKINLIIGLIAILKLGAAYVPIDINYPLKQIQFILKDSNAALVLVAESIRDKMQAGCIDQEPPLLILDRLIADVPDKIPIDFDLIMTSSEDLAYIMYTSGTTGTAKGVMVPHRGIIRLVKATNYVQITAKDRVAHAASIGFDAATFEIWGALLNGAALMAVPQEALLNVMAFSQFLREKKISILWLTSALFNEYAIINPFMFKTLSYLLVGGDVLNPGRIMKVLQCEQSAPKYIVNGYGPTENTTFTTCFLITPQKEGYQSIPIGKPIANTTVYVLDKYLEPVPIGAPGELYTGGDGVALGYLNQPEITSKRFIPNLYNNNEGLLYKTEDIVRWLPDGTLDYLGRQDNQVKIRGFRVELEVIYTVLLHHESINQCTVRVVKNERHQKFIAAYIVLNDETQIIDIQKYMAAHLPQYMIPSFFIKLDKIPLTLNGKVNFEALPAPNFSLHSLHAEYSAPHTQTEKKVEKVWCALFKLDRVGIHDSFFHLGGHSLMMTQLVLRIKEQLGYDLSLQQFLENPTISHLGHLIDKNRSIKSETSSSMPLWHSDAELTIFPLPSTKNLTQEVPKAVLLTGANGFLGSSLLYQLYHLTSATIYCLVRGRNKEEVKTKWDQALNCYYPELKDKQRIRLLVGDLEKSYLGLSLEEFMNLANTLDIIYHNGALVNHLYNYELLRRANVLSVKELIKLATVKRLIPIHYVSTLSAVSNYTDHTNHIIEDFIVTPSNSPPQDGYSQTKWVAEQLFAKAHQNQIPIKIYRPGWILGHSSSGIILPKKNHLLMLLKGCLQLGVAPDWDISLNILPVEYVSQLIVKTSLNKKIQHHIFNLINPNELKWSDLIAYLKYRGYCLSLCSPKKWRDLLVKKMTPDNALYSLITLYINQNNRDWMDGLKKISAANNQNTLHALKENKMQFPLIDQNILNIYFNYLEQTGFLDELSLSG